MRNVNIAKVLKKDGKVALTHCGFWPDITVYKRVDIDGERFFMLERYGKGKLYKPNKQTHCMEYVKSIQRQQGHQKTVTLFILRKFRLSLLPALYGRILPSANEGARERNQVGEDVYD